MPADDVARLVRSVIAFPPIRTLDPALLLRSLEGYETHRIDFAEAYLVASAEATGIDDIISYDRRIDRVLSVHRIEPGPNVRHYDSHHGEGGSPGHLVFD